MSIENQKQPNIDQENKAGTEYAAAVSALEATVTQKMASLFESPDVPVVVAYTDENSVERLLHLDGYTDAPKYGQPTATTVVKMVNPDLDKPDWNTVEISNGIAKRVAADPEHPSKKYYKKMSQEEVKELSAQIDIARAVRGRELDGLDISVNNSYTLPEVDDLVRVGTENKKKFTERIKSFGKTATYHAEKAHDIAMSDRPFPRKFE